MAFDVVDLHCDRLQVVYYQLDFSDNGVIVLDRISWVLFGTCSVESVYQALVIAVHLNGEIFG